MQSPQTPTPFGASPTTPRFWHIQHTRCAGIGRSAGNPLVFHHVGSVIDPSPKSRHVT
jgi:hypothetical protein